MNRKGFAPILIIGIIALVVIAAAVGWYFVAREHAATPTGVACTADAKQCPDGSYVGRTGPDCQFAVCPAEPAASSTATSTVDTSGWKTYTSNAYDFSFQYPGDLSIDAVGSSSSIVLSGNATSALAAEYDLAVSVIDNPNNLSIQRYFSNDSYDNGADLYTDATISTTTIASLPAAIFTGSTLYNMTTNEVIVFPYQGGFMEIVNNNLDDDTFNAIVNSFQFSGTN